MNDPNAEKDQHGGDSEANATARQHQQNLNTLNLFRLLETAVQNSQFSVGGQVVVRAHDIVGLIKSARTSFEEKSTKTVLELNQAAESFRSKVVRWESEARAAQSGQRQKLAGAQKRHLQAEIATVRAAARKTNIFFDRLVTALTEWAATVTPEQNSPAESAEAAERRAKLKPIYDRQHGAYVPDSEAQHKAHVSAEGLTMMTMIVRQQFEQLGELIRRAKVRDIEDSIQSAFDAFREGRYLAARSRLKLAHQAFLQAAMTRRIVNAEIAEVQFETVLQGTNMLVEAANQNTDIANVEHAPASQTARKAAADPVQDLRRLQQILQNNLDAVFPPSSPNEQRETATKCMDHIASGQSVKLRENLRSLLRAINYGADNNAPETKEAKELIKRLGAHTPKAILRPQNTTPRSRSLTSIAGADADEDGITLDVTVASTKCFTLDPLDIRQASVLQIDFQNSSTETAQLQVQIYGVADKPLLNRPAPLRLPATKEINTHSADIAEEIDSSLDNTLAVTVEFIDVPDHVEISKANLTGG